MLNTTLNLAASLQRYLNTYNVDVKQVSSSEFIKSSMHSNTYNVDVKRD